MSDDLDKKIKQITDALGQEKLPENLMSLLSLLAGSASSQEKGEVTEKAVEAAPAKEEKKDKPSLEDSGEMIGKMKRMMDRANIASDPRIGLLSAIRPFMNNRRQKKINSCINLLRISSLARMVDDNGKGIF